MSAFWKRNKQENDNSDQEQEHRDSDQAEEIEEYEIEEYKRLSRRDYKKMQKANKPAKTLAERKEEIKETATQLFFRYILPIIVMYLGFLGYQYLTGSLLVKMAGTSFFWILHILTLGIFIAIIYKALSYMLKPWVRAPKHAGIIFWFGSIYFYINFFISYQMVKGPILAAAILFVTGVIQLTNLSNRIKGGFILIGTLYGNYLTVLDFPNVWLTLGISGLFILLERNKEQEEIE